MAVPTIDQLAGGQLTGIGKGTPPQAIDTAKLLNLFGTLRDSGPAQPAAPRAGLNGVPTGLVTPFQQALIGRNPVTPVASQNPYGGFVQGGWGLPHDRLMRSTPQDGLLLAGTGPGTVQNPDNNPYPALPVDNSPVRPVDTTPVNPQPRQPVQPYVPPQQQQPQQPAPQQPQSPTTPMNTPNYGTPTTPPPASQIEPGSGGGDLHNVAPNGALATTPLNLTQRFGPLKASYDDGRPKLPFPEEGFLQYAQRIGFPVGDYGAAATYAAGATPGGRDSWLSVLQGFYGK